MYHIPELGVWIVSALMKVFKSDLPLLELNKLKPFLLLEKIIRQVTGTENNIKYYLEEKLGIPVDLVTTKSLKPLLKEQILKEVIFQ